MGNLLAALAFRLVYPAFTPSSASNGWRLMFFIGGLPALLSLFIRAKVKESEAWHEHRTDWASYRALVCQHWRRFAVSRPADDDDELHVARHAGHVPDVPAEPAPASRQSASPTSTMLASVGAILGGLVFGYYSDRAGRRNAR